MKKNNNIIIFSSGNQEENINQIINLINNTPGNKARSWREIFTRKDENNYIALMPILLKKIPTFDFVIVFAGADDFQELHRKNGDISSSWVMRDNLVFELGLSIMALGQTRTIIVADNRVRMFDDLRGVNGIVAADDVLCSHLIGCKCINFTDFEQEIHEIVKQLNSYTAEYKYHYAPVVIGASCSSAVGYYNNFIGKLTKHFTNTTKYSKVYLTALIPNHVDEATFKSIKNFYEENGYVEIVEKIKDQRDVVYRAKIEGDIIYIVDIPTTITTSYDTAIKLLGMQAEDIQDENDQIRFLDKELENFEYTLKRMLIDNADNIPNNVVVNIEQYEYLK